MAGSVSISLKDVNRIQVLRFDWIGDISDGSVPAASTATSLLSDLRGAYKIDSAITNPGSPAPTTDYDITITDGVGVDLLGGELSNRSSSVSERVMPKLGNGYGSVPLVFNNLTFNLSNNSATGAQGSCFLLLSEI